MIKITPNDKRTPPPKVPLRISAVPSVRQVLWCSFWEDAWQPEMWKERPVVIVSFSHVLSGHCCVLPTSTDPQEGLAAKWAHKLSIKLDGMNESWVVCNHPYTVSNARLAPFPKNIRLSEKEFNEIIGIMYRWLPKPPEA